MIQYLRDVRGMTFEQACVELGELPKRMLRPQPKPTSVKAAWQPKESRRPSDVWQEKAIAFVAYAERILWSNTGETVRMFLHARGLSDETTKHARLGWHPKDVWLERAS